MPKNETGSHLACEQDQVTFALPYTTKLDSRAGQCLVVKEIYMYKKCIFFSLIIIIIIIIIGVN